MSPPSPAKLSSIIFICPKVPSVPLRHRASVRTLYQIDRRAIKGKPARIRSLWRVYSWVNRPLRSLGYETQLTAAALISMAFSLIRTAAGRFSASRSSGTIQEPVNHIAHFSSVIGSSPRGTSQPDTRPRSAEPNFSAIIG